jgi:hypothetical protein
MSVHPPTDLAGNVTTNLGVICSNAGVPSVITAGAGLDNAEWTGPTIDRRVGIGLAHSAQIATTWIASLTAAQTISLRHRYQTSPDNATWSAAVEIEALTAKATGPGGGGNAQGIDEHSLNLRPLDRYIRFLTTLDLSAGGADLAVFTTTVVLGGFDRLPQ